MLFLGIAFLIGGVYIRYYRLWANKMISILSFIVIMIIWSLMITKSPSTELEEVTQVISMYVIQALFWSTPMVILVWFLNMKEIKKHFV